MVNKKPSTGCGNCRQRHVKCDEGRPDCQKCASRGIRCVGYRDVNGLIFVNNTRLITERHVKRNKNIAPTVTKNTHHADAATLQLVASHSSQVKDSEQAQQARLIEGIRLGEEAVAVAFFFSHYVAGTRRGPLLSRGHLDHLVPLYLASQEQSTLALATKAMAYQALSLYEGADHHRIMHATFEIEACQALKQALSDPIESVKDDTLMAVLCLDFAAHLSTRENYKAASRAHIDGALALVRHRSPDSFQTDVARSLFAATRSNVLLQCLWFGDDHAMEAIGKLPQIDLGEINPVVDIQHILARALTLEVQMFDQLELTIGEQRRRRDLAQSLNLELDTWYAKMPLAWRTVITQPHTNDEPTSLLTQAAYVVGQWHCMKVLALKLVYGTTDDEAITASIPHQVDLVLKHLCSIIPFFQRRVVPAQDDSENKTMDRTSSSVVSIERNGPSIYVGSAPSGRNYLLNILRWIFNEWKERPPGTERFAEDTEVVIYLRALLDQLMSSFTMMP